jgi:hypothetical protein
MTIELVNGNDCGLEQHWTWSPKTWLDTLDLVVTVARLSSAFMSLCLSFSPVKSRSWECLQTLGEIMRIKCSTPGRSQ